MASSWFHNQLPAESSRTQSSTFEWDSILPSKHLQWHQCRENFQCARLQVPMDWLGTSDEAGRLVDLALIKVEASMPVTDASYGGAVVLNPGGPGGSGVQQVLKGGHAIQTILSAGLDSDESQAEHPKYFDIIGFDPRGINNSRPVLNCFPNHLEAAASTIEENAHGMIGTSDTSFDYLWASKRALTEGCTKHMATASVARDIVEIFERHGEWRANEATRLLRLDAKLSQNEQKLIKSRTAYIAGSEMVQYWGFSYGSILGATLSAMFPERIHRAVLDGVADSHDYMAGGWTSNLNDTDLIFAKMAEHCWEGGANCALWDEDGPAVIAENVQKIMADIMANPISVPGTEMHGPVVITSNDLKRLFRTVVYWPLRDFPFLARVLHDLSERNGTSLALWLYEQRPEIGKPLSEACLQDGPYSPACFPGGDSEGASAGIACSDGPGDRLSQTKKEYREYATNLTSQSRLMGESWATIQLPCTAWHARPHWRYEGNFHNKTAHPILFAGNTIDPVTPLQNAFKMASGFEGAGVLHQDSEGHCTYSGLSMCSMKAIRHYFQTGELPGKVGGLRDWDGWDGIGALCETDRRPFDGYSGDSEMPELPDGEIDKALWYAMIELNRLTP
ncbi:hypothetical protein D0869_01892 [Hortaea werneckii]|uniref:Peptidase S33 tripeptidyl aminopeptidase-like C-terminal domain-containing protein n=1 Tax=Hortaea werneckii TaxID=91943 RepID=A0A3M6XBB3_HORWE|nr:hypothetical protein D0869_01892 [Hortaea werneckii]